jgi:hypothetical protein
MADPEVQDAADQLERDAAMVDDELHGASVEALSADFAGIAGGSIELASADTDAYETVGGDSR